MSHFLASHSLGPAPFGGWAFTWLWVFPPLAHSFSLFCSLCISTILLCYFCCGIIWPEPARLLWAYYLFFSQWLSMVIGLLIASLAGSHAPFVSSWASLSHLLSLDFFYFFPNSAFPWVFTNSFELPWPNYLIPHPWGSWTCYQLLTFFACITSGLLWPILIFLHHILPMSLPLLSLRAPLGPFVYFMGLQFIIPAAWV